MSNYVSPYEERWKEIPGFSDYLVSSHGKIYSNKREHELQPNPNNYGHMKINLYSDHDHQPHTLSVAKIVAEAFVEPMNARFDHVAVLDGDFSNLAAENLVWRPRWFVWNYTNQLKRAPFPQYLSFPVRNRMTGDVYENVMHCGMTEGLLFKDIVLSVLNGEEIFPHWHSFEDLRYPN